MAFCSNCGAQITDGVQYCPSCGTQVGNPAPPNTTPVNANDAENNKAMGILAYLGILVIVPILAAKESQFARFHANQGLVLCLGAIAYAVAISILIPILIAISWRLGLLFSNILWIGSLFFGVLAIMGIINAATGKMKELPIIGKFTILK